LPVWLLKITATASSSGWRTPHAPSISYPALISCL